MSLNPAKCLFFENGITFFGTYLSEQWMHFEDEKVGRVKV